MQGTFPRETTPIRKGERRLLVRPHSSRKVQQRTRVSPLVCPGSPVRVLPYRRPLVLPASQPSTIVDPVSLYCAIGDARTDLSCAELTAHLSAALEKLGP